MARVSITGDYAESYPIEAHEVIHGDSYPLVLTVRDERGAAIDLTGWATDTGADFHLADVKVLRPGGDGVMALTVTNFETTNDPARDLTSLVSDATAGRGDRGSARRLGAAQSRRRCEQDRLRDSLHPAPTGLDPPDDAGAARLQARAVMTDDQVAELILWEVKIAGGRLALMGATDAQIVRAWLAVLNSPLIKSAPSDSLVP